MNTEQEVLPCPLCNAALSWDGPLATWVHPFDDCHLSGHFVKVDEVAAWNRRSSDEQAEVVGYILPKNLAEDVFQYTVYRIRSVAEAHAEKGSAVALYASPPTVVAGRVTEDILAALDDAAEDWALDSLTAPASIDSFKTKMRAALTAALAVGNKK